MKTPSLLTALALACLAASASAQVKAPPPPAEYAIDIRYEIDAFPNERSAQFKEMVEHFKKSGFVRSKDDLDRGRDEEEETNRAATRMAGTIPSDKVGRILDEPHVLSVKLVPAGKDLPAADQRVRVDLTLLSGSNPDRQRQLARELIAILAKFQFVEAVGYDHRTHTRILGTIPAGQLETFLTDVRRTPAALAELPQTLLRDLRAYRDGDAVLQAVLPRWWRSEEGRKFSAPILADWRKEPSAIRYVQNLPIDVAKHKDVVDEELFEQLIRHPDGAPYLDRLMAGAQKSSAVAELLEPIIRRLRGRAEAAVLPALFRPRAVVRVLEARPDLPLPSARPAEVKIPDDQRKLAPDVRLLAVDQAESGKMRRMEIFLSEIPEEGNRNWARNLERVAPDLEIEGRVGPMVSALLTPKAAAALVALTQVSTIRLPLAARPTVWAFDEAEGKPADALKFSGLDKLHEAGNKGKKVRVGVVAGDFRGWQGLVGKGLPAKTRFVDLTLERNVNFVPDPFPGDAKEVGAGTQMALAVMLAAPETELTLIRVDPAAPHLVALAARRIAGQQFETEALRRRGEEMNLARIMLDARRKELNAERRRVLDEFPFDKRPPTDERDKARRKALEEYEKHEATWEADHAEHVIRTDRLLKYRAALDALADVRVVVSGLVWSEGHALDGTGGLAQLLDDLAECDRVWFQATGPLPGQAWSGLFLDPDGNGRMNYVAPVTKQAQGTWDAETNFLGWKGRDAKVLGEIPAGTKVRVTLQWAEAHDADFAKIGDPYREPLSKLRLVVLKQLDPAGKARPSDDVDFLRQSEALPQRLREDGTSGVYQHSVEFTAEAGVRYILSVEGTLAGGTAPAVFPSPPLGGRVSEIKPRLLVEADTPTGQPVFESYHTEAGAVSTPADALRLITVGAGDGEGKGRWYSGRGTPYMVDMVGRPEVVAPDRLGGQGLEKSGGTGISAAFSAGWAASVLSGGQRPECLLKQLRQAPGQPLRVPAR